MLATALQALVKTGELRRSLSKKSVDALRDGKLNMGRHILYMISDHDRLSDNMSMVYPSRPPIQVGLVKCLGSMDPNVDIGDEAWKHILDEQLKHPQAFGSGAKRYYPPTCEAIFELLRGTTSYTPGFRGC